MNKLQLVAHRGYPEHFPENTLLGIMAAIRAGARFVEVDIQLSADEIPVLLHDRTLQRVCGVKGVVHHMSFAELRRLHPSEYERFGYRFSQVRIPSLAEFRELLESHPGVTAFIELKRSSAEHFGPTVVLNRVMRELESVAQQVVIISFSFDVLLTARNQGVEHLGAIIHKWSQRKQAILREVRAGHVICEVGVLPRWGKLRVPGAKLMVYEITDARLALRLAARGVNLIESFAIGEMFEQLELLEGAE
ncbi:MAG: glycerophosphodiester phosphodiesterase family protein [Acidiferrobacterales bacterium]